MDGVFIFSFADKIHRSLNSSEVREIAPIFGIADEISGLEQTFSRIKAVLVDAEEKQIHSPSIAAWLKMLEHCVYDADDFVDCIITEALLRRQARINGSNNNYMVKMKLKLQQVRNFFSWPNQFVFHPMMAHKIKAIKVALAGVDSNIRIFRLVERRETNLDVCRGTTSFVLEEEVIGREDDIKAITKILLDPTNNKIVDNVFVVAVMGQGGLGKTRLAQLVFRDEEVQKHFDLKLWVSGADGFDIRLLVEKVIQSAAATGNKSTENHLEKDELREELRKLINGKRYLIVLDDMRDQDCEWWMYLKDCLRNNAIQGNRVIITTRNHSIACTVSTIEPYMLGILDEDASWSLFKKFAFKPGQEPHHNFAEIGKQIVNKCGGNPLAIRTIGSMLYFKDSESDWNSLNMELTRVPRIEDDMLQTLKLGFDSLPSHLKQCFAYCCIFPKECEINVRTLINLWMAQGFISLSKPNRCMEDVGYGYFHELFWRSFFQDIEIDKHGMLTKCKMHSVIHDLAKSVAGTRCSILSSNESPINISAHHLSFNFHLESNWQIPNLLVQATKLRTIFLSNQSHWETEGRSSKSICGNMVLGCKRLRVLDLHNSGINIVPPSIGKLKHLRYLDLSRNMGIKALPCSITKLYLLQTLKLNFCERLQQLPRDIKRLIDLRNLEIDGCYSLTHMPCGLGQLTNLRTLSEFVLSKRSSDLDSKRKGGLDELQNLDDLRGELRIKNLRHGAEYEVANLDKKQLQSLMLIWNNDDLEATLRAVGNEEMNVDSYFRSLNGLKPHTSLKEFSLSAYGGVRFPDWFSSLTSLVRLSLWRCKKCRYIPLLHQFSSLEVLTLDELTNLEYILENDNNQFNSSTSAILLPPLKELRLTDLPDLKGWCRRSDENQDVGDTSASSTEATIQRKGKKVATSTYQPLFPCLSKLIIKNCPKLEFMPLYPYLNEVLQLNNSSWKPFLETMTMSVAGQQIPTTTTTAATTEEASSSSSRPTSRTSVPIPSTSTFTPLSKLRNLCIVGMVELGISIDGDVIMWEAFQSLQSLTFDHLPNLKTLPEGLQQINSLQELHLHRCNNLEAIPDWIIKLKSLKKLVLRLLPNLTSLPEELYGFISSQKLEIEDCPKIAQKANPVQDLIMKFLGNSGPRTRIMQ